MSYAGIREQLVSDKPFTVYFGEYEESFKTYKEAKSHLAGILTTKGMLKDVEIRKEDYKTKSLVRKILK